MACTHIERSTLPVTSSGLVIDEKIGYSHSSAAAMRSKNADVAQW
jgi:hypothetical protein